MGRPRNIHSDRDPVENAFRALACLSNDDRAKAVERFNAVFERSPSVPILTLTPRPAKGEPI